MKEVISEGIEQTPKEEKFNFPEIGAIKEDMISLCRKMKEAFDQARYNVLVSDEVGGRIPALILRKIIKKLHPDKELRTLFVASGQKSGLPDYENDRDIEKYKKELRAKIQKELDQENFMERLDELKLDMFQDRIFVFTPDGDVIDLPEDSSPIDFAYAIHTEIGDTCIGAKINEDIASAVTNLEGYTRANKTHINKSVALAIQAQIALVQGSWDLAATSANAARQGFNFMTTAQHQDGYNSVNNPEFMWASYVQEDQTMYYFSFYAFMSHSFGSAAIRQSPKSILKDLYDLITPSDVRKTFWHPNAVELGQPTVPLYGLRFNYMNSKFKSVSESDSRGDFPWIRVAEMYLIEAEALARQTGKEEQAKDILYLLANNRDPQYVRSDNSGQDLIDEILIQRRIELWGEGRNFTDLKRLGLPLVRPEAPSGSMGGHVASIAIKLTEPAGTNNWTWMIPRAELDSNPNLEQNPS